MFRLKNPLIKTGIAFFATIVIFFPSFIFADDPCPAGKTWQTFENTTSWYVRLMYDDGKLVSHEFPEIFPAFSETAPRMLMRCMPLGKHQFHFQAQHGDRTFAVWNFELEITEANQPIVITETAFTKYPWWGRANLQINIAKAVFGGIMLMLGVAVILLFCRKKQQIKKA